MTARRQSSATSLAKYARVNSPDLSNRSLDFCNAFWGAKDGGVDVLFARMRGAMRSVDEIRAFWKERASIEEDYAKRLAKLAKQTLGKDEIGELRNSLDSLRLETDKQASAHLNLAHQIRSEMEQPASAFLARQTQFKRVYQAVIEKQFKNKQTAESYVTTAREKYEADCMRINSYSAQSTLVQGKDLEKIQIKLDRARKTVTANERDFANFARELQRTVEKWEKDWKAFCDGCQDLEEERIEFMKDNVWAYANAVSTVCVSDDEACEFIRVSLEQLEPERDMENFVRDYGTGNEIHDPPKFVSYTNPDPSMNAPSKNVPRYAQFPRASQRQMSMAAALRSAPPEDEPDGAGMAGFGAGGNGSGVVRNGDADRTSVHTQSRPPSVSPINGTSGASVYSQSQSQQPSQPVSGPASPSYANPDPAGPGTKSLLKIGDRAYEVNPEDDPQAQPARNGHTPSNSIVGAGPGPSNAASRVGAESDPLAKQMEELRNSAASSGPVRRQSANVTKVGYQSVSPAASAAPGPSTAAGGSSLATPSPSASHPANRDYRNSAELVVGAHPSASRPQSPAGSINNGPAPPTAALMQPPSQKPSSPLPVEEVLAKYQQSLPGERRTPISRSNSPGVSPAHSHSQSLGQNINQANRGSLIERPRSREGFAGVGAGGRSPSPAHSPSNSFARSGLINAPAPVPSPVRIRSPATGPNIGISLDESGRVAHDAMAEQYRQPPPVQPPQSAQPAQPPQMHPAQGSYGAPRRNHSVQITSPVGPPPPLTQQPAYGTSPSGPYGQPAQQPPYTQTPAPGPVPPQTSGWYNPHASQPPQPPQQPPQLQQYPPAPTHQPSYPGPPQQPPYQQAPNGTISRGPSATASYPQNMNGAYQNGSHGFRAPSPQSNQVRRSPSPAPPPVGGAPTGQYINGRPILFYVKAMYDYQATIEEEFDFQTGDVIAVTSTPEDGWWTGVLLDDSRRIPGRTIFPSNFVCLF